MISISSEKNARALIKAVANNSEEAWIVIEKESMKASARYEALRSVWASSYKLTSKTLAG